MVAPSAMSGRVCLSLALALSGLAVWGSSATPLWAASAELATEAEAGSEGAIAQNSSNQSYTILHVNPRGGIDGESRGTQLQPLKTITYALSVAEPSTLILLAGGIYSADTGETFPLRMRPGVTVQGAAGPNAADVVIQGGESYISAARGLQNVAILGGNNAGLANVTVSNPHPGGVGVWIESGSPIIQEVAFFQNGSTGVYIAGDGAPVIRNSYFAENGDAGLVIAGPSSAQVQGNRFENTGTGISVAPEATPEISDNHISHNADGLVIHADAQPVLENNQIHRNRRNSILDYAPWSDTLTATAPLAAQPPPPSMTTTAAAITPGATPQPLAVGGPAPADSPPAAVFGSTTGQTFTTALGGIATGSEQPAGGPEPSTGPAPETLTPNPLFTESAASAPPSTNPEVSAPEVSTPELTESSQTAAAIAIDSQQPPSPSELTAYPAPPTLAVSPTAVEPPTITVDLAAEATSAPAVAIAAPDSPPPIAEPLPTVPTEASAAASRDPAAEVLPTPTAGSNDSIPDAERRPPTAENTVPDSLTAAIAAEPVAFSGPPPTALTSFGQDISTELEATAPTLKAVDIAIVPAMATTALFSNVDLTTTLAVPEAIAVSLAEESSVASEIVSDDIEATDEPAANRGADSLAEASTDGESTIALDPALIRPPTERLVSLTEPSIEIERNLSSFADSDEPEYVTEPLLEGDRSLSLSSDSEDGAEAIDLTVISPPAEDIVLPTRVSRSTLGDSTDALTLEEAAPDADADSLSALPSPTADSLATESDRLAVPSANIPVGSGGDLPELFAAGVTAEGPPPPPSRAAALGLSYRVLIEETDASLQDQIRQQVPDAFRVKMNGREFIQVGAYPTFEEAQAQAERLNQQGLQAQIEQIF